MSNANNTDPIVTPLTPAQAAAVDASADHESVFHKDMVAIDVAANEILFEGIADQTISSHAAEFEHDHAHGFKHAVGKIVCEGLNLLEGNHGAKAEEADKRRAEELIQHEDTTGIVPTT